MKKLRNEEHDEHGRWQWWRYDEKKDHLSCRSSFECVHQWKISENISVHCSQINGIHWILIDSSLVYVNRVVPWTMRSDITMLDNPECVNEWVKSIWQFGDRDDWLNGDGFYNLARLVLKHAKFVCAYYCILCFSVGVVVCLIC